VLCLTPFCGWVDAVLLSQSALMQDCVLVVEFEKTSYKKKIFLCKAYEILRCICVDGQIYDN